ncbi:Ribonuclease BN, tRNA processing enzyme [Amycolatopsis marina]|uniref:Ribonuclease BN, tRNA processing enzyme n=1 Tax=Amycolatopsis marina TaxID=490629 RepID=A0A1I1A450_9PSEU|nr:MBL fold metallo-hydrolase [Amycolatopsis marina]SFB32731.1 Ribonuclease BN, tRNA processing enzyme [Amycolatopsis marina]
MRRLRVLGSSGAWPEPGGACSGYLLEYDGFRVVLDLGYGTASRLFEHCQDRAVDAVVITHEHPDHCADLTAVGRAHYFAERRRQLPLYCPPGVLRVLESTEPRPDPHAVFEVHDIEGTQELGPFRLTGFPLPHHVPDIGVRLSAPGLVVAYTGDSGPSPELARLAENADLFIADATLQGPAPDTTPRYVMTATEAGTWAARARARTLLLTHFWPGSDRIRSVTEAAAVFEGRIIAAEDGLEIGL